MKIQIKSRGDVEHLNWVHHAIYYRTQELARRKSEDEVFFLSSSLRTEYVELLAFLEEIDKALVDYERIDAPFQGEAGS